MIRKRITRSTTVRNNVRRFTPGLNNLRKVGTPTKRLNKTARVKVKKSPAMKQKQTHRVPKTPRVSGRGWK